MTAILSLVEHLRHLAKRFLRIAVAPSAVRGRRRVGPEYHRHETVGAELCAAAGSDRLTVAMVRDQVGGDLPAGVREARRAADDI